MREEGTEVVKEVGVVTCHAYTRCIAVSIATNIALSAVYTREYERNGSGNSEDMIPRSSHHMSAHHQPLMSWNVLCKICVSGLHYFDWLRSLFHFLVN